MPPLGVRTAQLALDEVYQSSPHLPRSAGLAQLIVNAHNQPADGAPGGLSGIVAALWPVAAAAGAQRGHAAALASLLDVIGRIDVDTLPDARSRWTVQGFRQAALDLPAAADPTLTYPAPFGADMVAVLPGLKQAVRLALEHGWRAGHVKATEALLAAYTDKVEDLLGADRLITTFLIPGLPAHVLLEEIDYLAYRFAELDREDPAGRPDPTALMARSLERLGLTSPPAATRAFPALRRLPHTRAPRHRPRPADGPGNRRPGR